MEDPADRYRRLAEALLQRMYPVDEIEARLGELPSDWPGAITVPAHTIVIGSVIRRRDQKLAAMTVYLEGALPADTALAHYESVLTAEGWTRFEPRVPGPASMGFRSAMSSPGSMGIFCRHESDPFYNVQVAERADRTGAVVTWDAGLDHHPLRQHVGPYGPGGPLGHLVPDLVGPRNVPVLGGGGGGSDSEWEIRARAQTPMPVAELDRHYREQLRRAGWTQRDDGGDAVVQWSRWKLPEDDYEGMFVVAEPLRDLRDLSLTIRSPSRAARGWRSWTAAIGRSTFGSSIG